MSLLSEASFTVDIIVLTRNNIEELEVTMRSVICQVIGSTVFLNVYIVDGSDDHTPVVNLLISQGNSNANITLRIYQDNPSRGIYPAMNFALQQSSGDALMFMNSGDSFYSPNALQKLVCFYKMKDREYDGIRAVFGQTSFTAYNGSLTWNNPECSPYYIKYWLRFYYPCHQSVLFNGRWARANTYSETIGVRADGIIIRKAIEGYSDLYLPELIAVFSLSGESSSPIRSKDLKTRESWVIDLRYIFLLVKFILSHSLYPYNPVPLISYLKANLVSKYIGMIHRIYD